KCRKKGADLLTIENDEERKLVTDITSIYLNESLLTYNGSTYKYYKLADFLWIDGVQQADRVTYVWDIIGNSTIPDHLWCLSGCNGKDRNRVMLNMRCSSGLACLGTRKEWAAGPFVCKKQKLVDACPVTADRVNSIHFNEMLIVSTNRTYMAVKCKVLEYPYQLEYQCVDGDFREFNQNHQTNVYFCPKEIISTPVQNLIDHSHTGTARAITTSTQYTEVKQTCSRHQLENIIGDLPTHPRNVYPIYSQKHVELRCSFDHSITVTYTCYTDNKWHYVSGIFESFRQCIPPPVRCTQMESFNTINKYFTPDQGTKIMSRYGSDETIIIYECHDFKSRRYIVQYKCGSNEILNNYQLNKLNSCLTSYPSTTSTSSTLIIPTVSMPQISSCPAIPLRCTNGSVYIDKFGCTRKECPPKHNYCKGITCPNDRVCRSIKCSSNTDQSCYNGRKPFCILKSKEKSNRLCQLEPMRLQLNKANKKIGINYDQSQNKLKLVLDEIEQWEHDALVLIKSRANEYRKNITNQFNISVQTHLLNVQYAINESQMNLKSKVCFDSIREQQRFRSNITNILNNLYTIEATAKLISLDSNLIVGYYVIHTKRT
ncbi:unnamed protein product, partial [Didymodactylos carnosus]